MQWWWIICLLPLAIVLYEQNVRRKKHKKFTLIRKLIKNRKRGVIQLTELIKEFIGKDCIIYTIDGQVTGTIEAVENGCIIIIENDNKSVVNLDFVSRVSEYPHNKKGKRKLVADV